MKAIVLQKFRDKNTKKIHKAGDIITINKERYEEILKVGKFVEEAPKETTKEATKDTPEDTSKDEAK